MRNLKSLFGIILGMLLTMPFLTACGDDESIDFETENQKISDQIQSETDKLLAKVLDDASNLMTNRFSMSD